MLPSVPDAFDRARGIFVRKSLHPEYFLDILLGRGLRCCDRLLHIFECEHQLIGIEPLASAAPPAIKLMDPAATRSPLMAHAVVTVGLRTAPRAGTLTHHEHSEAIRELHKSKEDAMQNEVAAV